MEKKKVREGGANLSVCSRGGAKRVSSVNRYQLKEIAGAAALGARHTPGAIERPAVVLTRGACQDVKFKLTS